MCAVECESGERVMDCCFAAAFALCFKKNPRIEVREKKFGMFRS